MWFFFADGSCFIGSNVVNSYYISGLSNKNAFIIDQETSQRAFQRSDLIGIFHSHTNGSSDMSLADKELLINKNLCYLVVGVLDHAYVSAKLFWWENDNLNEIIVE